MKEYEIMRQVIEAKPSAGEAEHVEDFWAALQSLSARDRTATMRSIAGSFFGQRRSSVLRSLRTPDQRERERVERESVSASYTAGFKKNFEDLIARKVDEIVRQRLEPTKPKRARATKLVNRVSDQIRQRSLD